MVVMTGTHPYSPLYDILNVILYTLYYNDMIITIIIHHHTTIVLYTHCRSSVSLLSLSFTHYTHYTITSSTGHTFTVNGQRLKHFLAQVPPKESITLVEG